MTYAARQCKCGCGRRARPGKAFASEGCARDYCRRKSHDATDAVKSLVPLDKEYAPTTPMEVEHELSLMSYAEMNACWVAVLVEAAESGIAIRDLAKSLMVVRDRYRERLEERVDRCKRAAG